MIISILAFGGLALLAIARGLYTIYKREGPLIGQGRKKIVKGNYAVSAGAGQIIMGLSFLIMAFNSYSLLSCSSSVAGLLLGLFIHFAGSFRDPYIKQEFHQQQYLDKARDNDPDIAKQRWESIIRLIVISLILGTAITAFMFYMSKDAIKDLSSIEFIRFFLLGAIGFSSLFFLGFLNVMIRKRARGEW
jgi:hypothetical protein